MLSLKYGFNVDLELLHITVYVNTSKSTLIMKNSGLFPFCVHI